MTIKMRVLTPLWTGDAARSSERVQVAGLVGSLRWWFEGIVRQRGGYVCEPIGGKGCQYDADKRFKSLCAACQVFGTTGWQRRFRLGVSGLQPVSLFFVSHPSAYESNANWLFRIFGGTETGGVLERTSAGPRVTFGVKMLWGQELTLEIHLPTRDELVLPSLLYSLGEQVRLAAIGGKTQNGFGQVEFLEEPLMGSVEAVEALIARGKRGPERRESIPDLFDVGHCFARVYRLRDDAGYLRAVNTLKAIGQALPNYQQHFVPCAFDIRYKSAARNPRTGAGADFGLRPWMKERFGPQVVDRLLGAARPRRNEERSASRIGVSHLYRRNGAWHLKIWGHVPPGTPSRQQVERAVDEFIHHERMFPGCELVLGWPKGEATAPR